MATSAEDTPTGEERAALPFGVVDAAVVPSVALGDDFEELVAVLEDWSAALVGAGEYPGGDDQIPRAWSRLPA